MNVDVVTQIVIDCPSETVAAYSAEPDNAPTWYANIRLVEWKTPRPLAPGSHVAFVAQFLGRRMAYTYEVAEFVPGEHLVMRTASGPFPMETTYTWESVSTDRTRMTLRNRGNPTEFSAWLVPFMTFAMRRANRKDLALLKRVLEGHSGETSPN